MEESEKLKLCKGCRDDYYNEPGHSTSGRCLCLAKAQVVTRYRIGWWTAPTVPGAFRKVETLNCHHAPGQYAHYDQVPKFSKDVING